MTTVNSVGKDRHIFIGWDNREAIGSIVCKFTLQLNSAEPKLSIQYLRQETKPIHQDVAGGISQVQENE